MNFQSIIDRLSEAFSVFDFSYFISGSASLAILAVFMWYNSLWPNIVIPHWMGIALLLIIVYVAGIVSMVLGKLLRLSMIRPKCIRSLFGIQDFDHIYTNSVETAASIHALECRELLNGDKKFLYTMMWSALRNDEKYSKTVSFINKYWVTQALCEGLLVSCTLAVFTCWITYFNDDRIQALTCIYTTLLSISSFMAFSYHARRSAETQIREVVVAYIQLKSAS